MLLSAESFGQHVSGLCIGGHIFKVNLFILDFLPQEVISYLNVLCAVIELWVFGDSDCGLVVDVKNSGERERLV